MEETIIENGSDCVVRELVRRVERVGVSLHTFHHQPAFESPYHPSLFFSLSLFLSVSLFVSLKKSRDQELVTYVSNEIKRMKRRENKKEKEKEKQNIHSIG